MSQCPPESSEVRRALHAVPAHGLQVLGPVVLTLHVNYGISPAATPHVRRCCEAEADDFRRERSTLSPAFTGGNAQVGMQEGIDIPVGEAAEQ